MKHGPQTVTAVLTLWCTLALLPESSTVRSAEGKQTPDTKPGPTRKTMTNSIGMKLAPIPGGKFTMGSPVTEADRNAEESPHEVEITRPFSMGVHEVTQAQYEKVMTGRSGRDAPANPSHFNKARGGGGDHPVEGVQWKEAVMFCEKLSALPAEKSAGRRYRLPSEAEWEYAVRAGSSTAFHFGDALSSSHVNFNGSSPYGKAGKGPYLRRTAIVGSYVPNAFGLHDMHGNVAEWCADFYDRTFYRRSPRKDPTGPLKGVLSTDFKGTFYRVARGGCWIDDARACRSAYRFRAMPQVRYRLIGFRVICVTNPRGERL